MYHLLSVRFSDFSTRRLRRLYWPHACHRGVIIQPKYPHNVLQLPSQSVMKAIRLWRPRTPRVAMRKPRRLGVFVWFGVALFQSQPSGVQHPLPSVELPGLLASAALTCQVAAAHLTLRPCFPSDSQNSLCCLMAASKRQGAFSCQLHISFFFFAAD